MNTLICIGQPAWRGNYTKSVVSLLSKLSADYHILYVNYHYTLTDIFKQTLNLRQDVPTRSILGLSNRLESLTMDNGSTVHVLTLPFAYPMEWIQSSYWYDFWMSINANTMRRTIRWAMKQLNMHHPIVINAFAPRYGPALAGRLDESALIYFCYDEITGNPWGRLHGERLEKKLLQIADSVVTTSEALKNSKCRYNPHCYLVKNGVDFALFNKGLNLNRKSTADRPVALFMGSLDMRMDVKLLKDVAQRLPNVRFKCVGRAYTSNIPQQVSGIENIEILGAKTPEELPALLAEAHVGIIPFLRNEHTRTVYPLKINEYMAAGLPVVTTNFSDLGEFEGLVRFADEVDDFCREILNAINEDDAELIQRRVALAASNSWDNRAQMFKAVIDETIRTKQGVPTSNPVSNAI